MSRWQMTLFLSALWAFQCNAAPSGSDLMASALAHYALPPTSYEEQVLIVTDRQGNTTLRTLRVFSQRNPQGSKTLRVLETPTEAKGTSLYTETDSDGEIYSAIAPDTALFGSNLTVMDLAAEPAHKFRYEREADITLERTQHFVIHATPLNAEPASTPGQRERRLYLRKDNLYLSRIDYLDGAGQVSRRLTRRAPAPDASGAWRPRMILVDDLLHGEKTLLKIERHIDSPDYVPPSTFSGMGISR